MEAKDFTLERVFEFTRQYMVPLYQRPYVWHEQWAPLWEDVVDAAERRLTNHGGRQIRPHFMGAIVLDQIKVASSRIETRLVIDGQQRLTTLQLLLAALRDFANEAGFPGLAQEVQRLTENPQFRKEDFVTRHKVVPTNVDREAFSRVMQAGSPTGVHTAFKLKGSDGRDQLIARAYVYFAGEVHRWVNADGAEAETLEKRLSALIDTVTKDLILVLIDLGEKDDAQIIFETLNARGTALLPSDLIKNMLFQRLTAEIGDGSSCDDVYHSFWEPFDRDSAYWREPLSQGRYERPRMDWFFHDYIAMQEGEEVPTSKLFTTFDEMVEKSGEGALPHIQRIARFGQVYRSFGQFPPDTWQGLFFARLATMEMTTAQPLLLHLFERIGRDLSEEAVRQVATDIESYLVRRMVCRLTTKNYNRFFMQLLNVAKAASAEDLAAALQREMAKPGGGDSVVWPLDGDFRNAWLGFPLYKALTKSRVKMVLACIERGMWSGLSDPIRLPDSLTVEHILPRKWKTHWPLPPCPEGEVPEEWKQRAEAHRTVLKHTVGNLTLLTKRLNPKVSNGPWPSKRAAFKEHCAYTLTREVCDVEDWDERTIQVRGERLFLVALKLWPRPVVARPEA